VRDSFVSRLIEIARRDPRVMLITGDLGFKVLDEYRTQFPLQYLNAGVAEQNMMGVASGMALEGRIVFTYSIGNFPTLRCLEQLRNDACYHNLNVNVVSVGSGLSYGSLGFSHHATEDISIMRALSNITIASPGERWEAEEATEALYQTPGVGYLRLDKSYAADSRIPGEKFELGKMRKLREGEDLTLVVTGGILADVLGAADQLATEGITCRVLNVHTVKPLDVDSIVSASKETGGIVTVEEHTVEGGLGSAIAELLLESGVAVGRFYRVGLREGFSTLVGDQAYLRKRLGIDRDAIAAKVRELFSGKHSRKVVGVLR
jgi:transketolase